MTDTHAFLKTLGIETGKSGPNEISAWYDTDSKDALEFLHWFTGHVSLDNVTDIQDDRKRDIGPDISGMSLPSYLNYEENIAKTEFVNDEIRVLSDELEGLEVQMKVGDLNGVSLQRSLADIMVDEGKAEGICLKNRERCEDLCNQLDKLNGKCECQIGKVNAEFAKIIDLKKCQKTVTDLNVDFAYVNIHHRNYNYDPMPQYISQSMSDYINSKCNEDISDSVWNFLALSDANILFNNSIAATNEETIHQLHTEIGSELNKIDRKYKDMLQIKILEPKMKQIKKNLKHLSTFNDVLTTATTYYLLLLFIYEQEIEGKKLLKTLVCNIKKHLMVDTQKSQLRSQKMRSHKESGQFKFLQDIFKEISEESYDTLLKETMSNINTSSKLSIIKYLKEISNFLDAMEKIIGKNLKPLEQYLKNEKTSDLLFLPFELHTVFYNIQDLLECCNGNVNRCCLKLAEAKKKTDVKV